MISRLCTNTLRKTFLVLVCIVITTGCAGLEGQRKPTAVPEIHPGILAGYLKPEGLPNSLVLLPSPPAEGSAAFALDEEVSRKSLALRGTPRWALATEDADLRFPSAAGTFSCALGIPITEKDTPHLYMLLRRTLADAGLSTYTAKNQYQRTRPFMVNGGPICTPEEEEGLRKDGSYPSGHTAIGWAWALILTEIAPDRADAILARGRALFLLDGLDEVPEELRRSLVELVAAFRVKYINNNFLFTGRPHGIDAGVKEYFGEFLRDIEYLDEKRSMCLFPGGCRQFHAMTLILRR